MFFSGHLPLYLVLIHGMHLIHHLHVKKIYESCQWVIPGLFYLSVLLLVQNLQFLVRLMASEWPQY